MFFLFFKFLSILGFIVVAAGFRAEYIIFIAIEIFVQVKFRLPSQEILKVLQLLYYHREMSIQS